MSQIKFFICFLWSFRVQEDHTSSGLLRTPVVINFTLELGSFARLWSAWLAAYLWSRETSSLRLSSISNLQRGIAAWGQKDHGQDERSTNKGHLVPQTVCRRAYGKQLHSSKVITRGRGTRSQLCTSGAVRKDNHGMLGLHNGQRIRIREQGDQKRTSRKRRRRSP